MSDFREQYNAFVETLEDIFMMDHEELDFGIYRIMNYKRDEIKDFLKNRLLNQVDEILAKNVGGDQLALETELETQLGSFERMGVSRKEAESLGPIVKLREKMKRFRPLAELKNDVYSGLVTFFSRYYKGGDFISQRRYKSDDTYAIPYNGEEVKLYWANEDQYYIKTSEYFKDYTFKIPGNLTVHFVLKDISQERNNNKVEKNKIRCFKVRQVEGLPVSEIINNELNIYFTYELYKKEKDLQKKLNAESRKVIEANIPDKFFSLKTCDAEGRSYLEKNLTDYTAKNSFDYFIHKDLGKFLRRELDFFLKSEVLNIDNLEAESIQANVATAKTIKEIGEKVISMLAQLEDYQKKLWLKKKFVVQTDYCITLDRIPEDLYQQIAENDAQRKEWVRLFHIEEIQKPEEVSTEGTLFEGETLDSGSSIVAYSEPLTIEFLKQNKNLVLDTAFFDDDFKHKLLESIGNIDEENNGVLVNSENFHALRLLQNRYAKGVKCIYVDPPYNTSASEIIYKNDYRDSSWLSLMENRLTIGKTLLTDDGIQCTTIDDVEQSKLNLLLENVFDAQPEVVAIRIKPSGRPIPNGFAIAHEYGLFTKANTSTPIARLARTDEQLARYREHDVEGPYFWEMLRKAGSNSHKEDRPTMYYPIYWNKGNNTFRLPQMEYNDLTKEYEKIDPLREGEVAVYPTKDDGSAGCWYFGIENIADHIDYLKAEVQDSGITYVYYRRRPNEGVQPLTTWGDSKYSATEHGTDLLKKMDIPFDYPKSIHAVEDCLRVSGCYFDATVLDYFGGSGTTCHAVINLNKEDNGKRKYVLCDMAEYFDVALRTRAERAIYSADWRDGKPQTRNTGVSQCFKYLRLEQYEDTLNNLQVKAPVEDLLSATSEEFRDSYMLHYMVESEVKSCVTTEGEDAPMPFESETFRHPFSVQMMATRLNEQKPTRVDLVETFNYLIGLHVEKMRWPMEGVCIVKGRQHISDKRIIVIWRDVDKVDNETMKTYFAENIKPELGNKAYTIYVNGENTLQNLAGASDRWIVLPTEKEFINKMYEE